MQRTAEASGEKLRRLERRCHRGFDPPENTIRPGTEMLADTILRRGNDPPLRWPRSTFRSGSAHCGNCTRSLRKQFPHAAGKAPQPAETVSAHCGSHNVRGKYPQRAGTLTAYCGIGFRRQRERFPHTAETVSAGSGNGFRMMRKTVPAACGYG